MIKAKAFIQALACYPHDLKSYRRFFTDKRLTLTEKKILKAWPMVRDKKLAEVIALLSPLSSLDPVVEAQRELILGVAKNNMGSPEKAIPHFLRSIEQLRDVDLPAERLSVYTKLFTVYFNLQNRTGMEEVLDHLNDDERPSMHQQLNIDRCKMNYFSFIGDYRKAIAHLQKIESHASHMNEAQAAFLFIDKFMLFLKLDDFATCRQVLQDMKSSRKYFVPENVAFMKALLAYISDESPLYLYPQTFKGTPLLYHQVQFLLAFEQRNETMGQSHWDALKKMFPHLYADHFVYRGDTSLFSKAFDKLKSEIHSHSTLPVETHEGVSNDDRLWKIVQQNEGKALSKDELYLSIYGKPAESKEELRKLVWIMNRIKTKYNLHIQSRKGFYIVHIRKAA